MIDITMTATRRPELLIETLSSFTKLMLKGSNQEFKLILNVDPVGHDIPSDDIVKICEGFFSNVIARCPEEASFPRAFRWCWEQTTSDLIFHLEEDWQLLRPMDLEHMISVFEHTPNLAILRLSYNPCTEVNKSWNKFIPWNGLFYEVPTSMSGAIGFSGHPSLIRKKFVAHALKMLDGKNNPEKQLRWRGGPLSAFRYGVYGFPGMDRAVLDLGRRWKLDNGWKKVDRNGSDGRNSKAFFTRWEKV